MYLCTDVLVYIQLRSGNSV